MAIRKSRRGTRAKRKKMWIKRGFWSALAICVGWVMMHHSAQASTFSTTDGTRTAKYLDTAFAATGAFANGFQVTDWSTLNHSFMDLQTLSKIGDELGQELSIQSAKISTGGDSKENYFSIEGVGLHQSTIEIALSSFAPVNNDSQSSPYGHSSTATVSSPMQIVAGSTVLSIAVKNQASSQPLNHSLYQTKTALRTTLANTYQQVENAVHNLGIPTQMSACILGALDAKIMGVQAQPIVNAAFHAVHATVDEGLNSTWETSISGYSPEGLTYIITNGKRMDLQVAVHDDTYHERTNVLVGTPIITTTY